MFVEPRRAFLLKSVFCGGKSFFDEKPTDVKASVSEKVKTTFYMKESFLWIWQRVSWFGHHCVALQAEFSADLYFVPETLVFVTQKSHFQSHPSRLRIKATQ